MHTRQRLPQLLEFIYDAAIDQSRWQSALKALSETFHGASTLFVQDTKNTWASIGAAEGFSEEFLGTYTAHYATVNPWHERQATLPAGSVVVGHLTMPDQDLERTEFYNDWLKPQGLRDGIGYYAYRDEERISVISVVREEKAGLYGPEEIRLWRALARHFHRALEVHRRLHAAEVAKEAASAAFDGLGVAVLVVDTTLRPLHMNAVAERMLSAGDALSVRNGRLACWRPDTITRLTGLVDSAVRTVMGHSMEGGGTIFVPRIGSTPLQALVAPLQPFASPFGVPAPAALLFLHDPGARPIPPEAALRRLWRLTPAEARLVQALVTGQRLEDYADERGIVPGTAKALLRRAFDKMGVRRQTDLVRVVASNPIARLCGLHEGTTTPEVAPGSR